MQKNFVTVVCSFEYKIYEWKLWLNNLNSKFNSTKKKKKLGGKFFWKKIKIQDTLKFFIKEIIKMTSQNFFQIKGFNS